MYLAFGKELRKVTPNLEGDDETSFDEMKSFMLVAAARAGWIEGIDKEDAKAFVPEDFVTEKWELWAILDGSDKVYRYYNDLRTPDPN